MNDKEFICKICGASLLYSSLVPDHLRKKHLINYSRYYEYCTLENNKHECPECRKRLYKLNPWSNYVLPCYDCNDQKLYYKKLFEIINGWQNYLVNGKYSSLWISSEDYRDRYLNFSFSDLDKIIDRIKSRDKFKIDPINLFDVEILSGHSTEISERNISRISLIKSRYHFEKKDFKFIKSINGYEFMVGKNKYSIILPEQCDYNNKTYYRYSIFNSDTSRLIKRLKVSSNTCIKFYNTILSNCKSILMLRKNGNPINSMLVSDDVFEYIKFYILRNKHLMTNIFNIYNELIKSPRDIQDNIFLLNNIYLNKDGKGSLVLNWKISEDDQSVIDKNHINLTLI